MTNQELNEKIQTALKHAGYVHAGGKLKQAEVARKAKLRRQTVYHKLKVKKGLTAKDINELLEPTGYRWTIILTNDETGDII